MNLRLTPKKLQGTVSAIPSKSMAHRLLICAALADSPTKVICPSLSQDVSATARCLAALGAVMERTNEGFLICPGSVSSEPHLHCGESGSTLRFLLPVVAALGAKATFHLDGRLGQRPLSPLLEELFSHGVNILRPDACTLTISGQLRPGTFTIPGNVSSQYISGLLFALPLLPEDSVIHIQGSLESASYVEMTIHSLRMFGVSVRRDRNQLALSPATFRSPRTAKVEGDWSNAAFWLTANVLGCQISVTGLNQHSLQGDCIIGTILPRLGGERSVDIAQIPDLFPVLAVAATAACGQTHFVGGARLRLKESDRIHSMVRLIHALGGKATETADGLIVSGVPLTGGIADSAGDHRVAMAAAIAATTCKEPVTVIGAQVVNKSYPDFWRDYAALGGQIEEI